jgi:hypothetical protein
MAEMREQQSVQHSSNGSLASHQKHVRVRTPGSDEKGKYKECFATTSVMKQGTADRPTRFSSVDRCLAAEKTASDQSG